MVKVAFNTIAAQTLLFLLVLPFIVKFMLWTFDWALDIGLNAYMKMTLAFIVYYIFLILVPTGFNVVWDAFKVKHPKRILITLAYAVALLGIIPYVVHLFLNGIYVLIACFSVFIANNWVIKFKNKTKFVLSITPMAIIIMIAIGNYIWTV
ncbi:hypothetical protein WMZ97_16700 [Lentibacillus sp. N15]|uniref:hypothetical protein n=1 Tax=Lentibacillus songyuanensis TaxID=3136161 RepID=UPI0031BAB836